MIDSRLCLICTGLLIFFFFSIFKESLCSQSSNQHEILSFSLEKYKKKEKTMWLLPWRIDDWRCYLSSFLDDGLQRFLFQEKMIVKENLLILVLFRISECNTTLKYGCVMHNFPLLTFLDFSKKYTLIS